ncbi:cytochrome P450 [Streptomyces sp. NPDC087428]|uniref:cytochrome P450 n=1 Tax=Streptomyces sp. NPDC087428 TaxID=3365788 RepID=UPI0038079376
MSTENGPAVGAEPRGHRIVPGPKGLPFLGNMPQFARNPLGFFERLRGHGDLVQWRFGPNPCVFVADPECIGELLTETERSFDQPALGIAFRTVMGNGVVVARGTEWRRKRSLVQPSVRPKQVRSYAATMAGSTVELADSWSGEEIGKEFAGIGALLPDWVPTPGRARIRKAAAVIDAEVGRVVARHRDGGAERPDLLSRLLTAVDETGAHLTDEEIRDETVTLYIGGHETTSSTLVWAWYLLSRNAGARAALHEELDRVLGGREPEFDDYARLAYTQSVVKETLRLYPTIWLVTGVAKEGARIGGVPLPEGTRVWSSQWATHRDERWFPEPEEFRPERWDAETGHPIAEYAWFPFGGGPRVCLGTRFAMVEAVLILAVLARRFELEVDPGTVGPVPTLTLQPDRQVLATVRARRAD